MTSSSRSRSGGNVERDHVQPEVQILAKPLLPHHLGQVLVRGGDHARVGVNRLRAADAHHDLLFQHAQQLGLAARLRSPISSRNSVPPEASSNLPGRASWASVNAPFSWPNSSLSSSVSVIARAIHRDERLSRGGG